MDTSARTRVQGRLSLTDDPPGTKKTRNHRSGLGKGIIVRNKIAEEEGTYRR
jgi:hypothetical protein